MEDDVYQNDDDVYQNDDDVYQNDDDIYQNLDYTKEAPDLPGEDYRDVQPPYPFRPPIPAKERKTGRASMAVSGVLIILLFIALCIMTVLYFQTQSYLKDVEKETKKTITSIMMDNSTSMSESDIGDSATLRNLEMIQTAIQTLQKKEENISGALAAMKEEFSNLQKEKNNLQKEKDDLIKAREDTLSKIANGWKMNGRNLYFFSTEKKNWNDSERFCASRRAHLTSILTSEEQNYLVSLNKAKDYYWIGLTDEGSEGVWRFVDGSPYTNLTFWEGAGPDNYNNNEHCVHFANNYKWNDNQCSVQYKWICKKPISL